MVLLLLSAYYSEAQSFAETALLFSRTQPGGSARIQSMGGAQIGLGADYSSALSNPAGLGMYNRSEFTFSPGINFASTSSTLFGQTEKDNKTTFYIPGFSLAFHNDYDKLQGFLGGTFSVAFTRVNDFNQNFKYGGNALETSIIDYFIEQATGAPVSQFAAGGALQNTPTHLGYENYLIGDSTVFDPSLNPNAYFTDVTGKPNLSEEIQTRGAQNQWSFAYGTNYNDKLFFGGGIGVTTIKYKATKKYSETFENQPANDLYLEETLEIRGSGVNAVFGITFRPIDFVQIGIAGTTPTYYELSDTYNSFMSTSWNNFQYDANTILNDEQYSSDILTSDYALTTPGKFSVGATVFLKKQGFITMDVERVNYEGAKYSSGTPGVSFDTDNEDIQSLFQSVYNIRAGGEYRLNSFRFRAGYAYMPQPFKATQNDVSTSIQRITAGAGYRKKDFYVDLAVVNSWGDNTYRPYAVNSPFTPLVTYSHQRTNAILTFGLNF